VNDPPRRELRGPSVAERAVGDDSYAEAYANGYGEGLRESLRELLGHITRGHTVAELRMLVESRLARVAEDVDLKRKGLTGPPQRTPWSALLKPPRPDAAPVAVGTSQPDWAIGQSYLFREERPEHAPRFVQRAAGRHEGVVWVGHHPPPELGVPPDRVTHLRPSGRPTGDGTTAGIGPGEIAGQIQSVHDQLGSILVYTDALEYLLTEYGAEPTVRFAMWLGPWAQENRSTTVVSLDPGAMEERDLRRVLKAFSTLA
jgi:hypothetical protein